KVPATRLELGLRALEAALEDRGGQGRLLDGLRIEDCGLRIGRAEIRNPQSPIRNHGGASRHKLPPLHRASPSPTCGLYYPPPWDVGRCGSMQFEARIEPLDGKLPKVTYRWAHETDTLSG